MNNEEVKVENVVTSDDDNILVVKNLKQYFPIEKNFFGTPTRYLRAVDGVSFSIKRGHTFGLVGESGCGKTTLGRTIIGLYNATDGEAYFEGKNVLAYNRGERNKFMAFEDKYMRKKALDAYIDENKAKYLMLTNVNKYKEYMQKKADAYIKNAVNLYENRDENRAVDEETQRLYDIALNPEAFKAIVMEKADKDYESFIANDQEAFKAEFEAKRAETLSLSYPRTTVEFMTTKEKRGLKTQLQMIFQDPYSSLSPRMCIGEIISEAVKEHKLVPNAELKEYTFKIMKECGLQPFYYQRYPHEFSGGQRQRIGIARSLALNPKLVICDEPVSALDVSIQAQIINLLKDLQTDKGLSYLFISHDLSVVEHISDDVGVMYLGNLVEKGTKEQIFNNPSHPYTLALLSAVPEPDPDYKNERVILKGELPSPANPPKGCKFHTRCDKCMGVCKVLEPREIEIEPEHMVKCHLFDKDIDPTKYVEIDEFAGIKVEAKEATLAVNEDANTEVEAKENVAKEVENTNEATEEKTE